uniref:Uncharacterized protein n=1 Tax=Heterosigma akashiwo TaxID=2829 RepID=A0A7S4DIC8_HETAK
MKGRCARLDAEESYLAENGMLTKNFFEKQQHNNDGDNIFFCGLNSKNSNDTVVEEQQGEPLYQQQVEQKIMSLANQGLIGSPLLKQPEVNQQQAIKTKKLGFIKGWKKLFTLFSS